MNAGKRNRINIIIDIILLLLFAAVSGIGFIMKYIMPSGHAVREKGAQSYASDIFGLDRHGWGSVHWILSVIFILFLIFHVILHWQMIVTMLKKMLPNNTLRRSLWVVITIAIFILMVAPFLFML